MIKILVLLAVLTGTAQARIVTVNNCSFWSYSSDHRGYVCSGYPSSVQVADGYDTARELDDANQKIRDLEERVRKLESALGQ